MNAKTYCYSASTETQASTFNAQEATNAPAERTV